MGKRARNTGSLQQRGKGRWRLRYWLQPEADGKRKQATETVRGTRRQAERVMRERLAAMENGGFIPKTNERVGEFMDRWMTTYAMRTDPLASTHGSIMHMK